MTEALRIECPYAQALFIDIPGYSAGYGCPLCGGLSYHIPLEGSQNIANKNDIKRAVDHIALLRKGYRRRDGR